MATMSVAAQTPLTLQQCIERAHERNIQVRQAKLAMQQAEIQLNQANNQWLPEVSASASENLSFGRGLTLNNTYESRNTSSTSLSVGASMPIYTGGRITHNRQRARLNLEAATVDVERLRENLALQITQAYLQVIYNDDMIAQSRENLALAQKQEQQIRQRIAAGKLPEIELAEAEARIANDQLSLVQAENNRHLALLALSQMLEFGSPDSLQIVRPAESELHPITGNPEEIFLLCEAERPALRAADLRIKAAKESIEIAKAGRRPTISANAGLGTSYYNTSGINNLSLDRQLRDNFSQNIGVSVSLPLFDRHTTRNNIKQAQMEVLNQSLAHDDERKRLFKEIQDAYYNALAAEQKYKAATVAAQSATIAMEGVVKKYESGRANATEFDEARHKHFTASTNRIAARYEYLFRTKILDYYRGMALQ